MKQKAWRWLGLAGVIAGVGGLTVLRLQRRRQLRALAELWDHLAGRGPTGVFEPQMLAGLPEPARRYLARAIAPGTPLARAVVLRMHGDIRLRRKAEPAHFEADQVITERAYIWRARARGGPLRISGYDRFANDEAEMRWWLYDLLPVVTASGANVSRSAAGRLAGELIFLPSALLPQHGTQWEALDEARARARIAIGLEQVELTITVRENGRLERLSLNRWNSAVANGPVGFLRFDVDELTEERTFAGYTVPSRLRAGWRLGSREAFPFYHAVITDARYA